MKTLSIKILNAFLILLSIFLLGIFIPMISSIFITITTETTLSECIESLPFWIITFMGWIVAGTYINEELTKTN